MISPRRGSEETPEIGVVARGICEYQHDCNGISYAEALLQGPLLTPIFPTT